MATLNPYLSFKGNAEEAFNFYKSVFGGEFSAVMRFSEMPPEHKMPESEQNKIMHISMPVGQTVLMGCDVPEVFGNPLVGTNFNVSISADSKAEADKLFNGLVAGGKVTMPIGDAFWGSYFGMLTDRFDIQWMVSYDTNPPQ